MRTLPPAPSPQPPAPNDTPRAVSGAALAPSEGAEREGGSTRGRPLSLLPRDPVTFLLMPILKQVLSVSGISMETFE